MRTEMELLKVVFKKYWEDLNNDNDTLEELKRLEKQDFTYEALLKSTDANDFMRYTEPFIKNLKISYK